MVGKSFKAEIEERKLPLLPNTKEEVLSILKREYLGGWPENVSTKFSVIETNNDLYGGKASSVRVEVTLSKDNKEYKYPFVLITPLAYSSELPVFIHLNFADDFANGLGEEIIDNGYALCQVNYQDIEPDVQSDSVTGLQGFMEIDDELRWGKIGVWAFGASKIIDYLYYSPQINNAKIAVVGHSRLGLAACWCGVMDKRVVLTICNNNGALYRGSAAETYRDLSRDYTKYWFSPNAFKDHRDADSIPFDMHYMHSLIAPRYLYLAGATKDQWADAHSMVLSAIASRYAYKIYKIKGLVCPRDKVEADVPYHDGHIGFHLRTGTHYLGRDDWRFFIAYRNKHDI